MIDRWVESLDDADRKHYALTAYGLGFICAAAAILGLNLRILERLHAERVNAATKEVQYAVDDVQHATVNVHAELERMAAETARAQRLAIWVGVGTALLGAVVGGFAGAFAAQLIG